MENESRPRGERPAPTDPSAQKTEAPHLAPQGEIFVAKPAAPRANRVLWDLIEEEMHVRRLALTEICRRSGVSRQTLLRYRDGTGRFIPEPVLQRLVAYFRSRPPGESEPTLVVRWHATDEVRARIADRVTNPDEAAILHACILAPEGAHRAEAEAEDNPAR